MAIDDWLEETDWLEEGVAHASKVKAQISIHDQKQVQIKLDYDRSLEHGNIKKVICIDAYFFMPQSVGINPRTYTKDNFFASLTNYLRVKTPRRIYWYDSKGVLSIPSADSYLNSNLSPKARNSFENLVIQDVKLLGCHNNMALKSLLVSIEKIKDTKDSGGLEYVRLFKRRLDTITNRIQVFRQKYVGSVNRSEFIVSVEVRKAFLLLDEYLSYRLESQLLEILDVTEYLAEDLIPSLNDYLKKVIEKEIYYRSRYIIGSDNQLIIAKNQGPQAQENIQYRLSLLKKYVYQVLYLNSEIIKTEKRLINIAATLATALAGLYYYSLITVQQLTFIMQADNILRIIGLTLFGVIAYVFRDRLKDLSREYFSKKFRQYLPDIHYNVTYTNLSPRGVSEVINIGKLAQFMQFVGRRGVPADILYIRDLESNFDLEPERQEEVFHFHHRFELEPLQEEVDSQRTSHIKEVLRLDITDYLNRMSDPRRSYQYWDTNKGIVKVDMPRVYHLNIVMRYTVINFKDNDEQVVNTEYQRLRLVMNKKGIIRIDEVLDKGELFLEENI